MRYSSIALSVVHHLKCCVATYLHNQVAIMLLFSIEIFNVQIKGNVGWVILLAFLQGFCGMTLGRN
uniref:Uncharacterized protein n=1 Tax=Strigamia maritima TaxID=126957 RepID=T1JNB9_STRMM